MIKYPKINTVYKRDTAGRIVLGAYSTPEFEFLKNCRWDWTEKVDGTNIRVGWEDNKILFGGRTDRAQLPVPLWTALTDLFSHRAGLLKTIFGDANVVLFGEGYGPKIQGGGKYRDDAGFVLFDVFVEGWWLKREDVEDVARQFGITTVPIIGHGSLDNLISFVDGGFESSWGNFEAEGIVARPHVELKARNGDRIITKLKCKDLASI